MQAQIAILRRVTDEDLVYKLTASSDGKTVRPTERLAGVRILHSIRSDLIPYPAEFGWLDPTSPMSGYGIVIQHETVAIICVIILRRRRPYRGLKHMVPIESVQP